MKKIDIGDMGDLGISENTFVEYDNEVSEDALYNHIERIANAYKSSQGYVCYVFGFGGQPKNTYTELRKERGVELRWMRSILPGPLKVFSFLIASYAGLVKINNHDQLRAAVKKMCNASMAGIYILKEGAEQRFLKRAMEYPSSGSFDFGIKEDSDYFFFLIDADSAESSTGIYEVVSYGRTSYFSGVM
jgi:hypothetical protein